MRATYSRSFVEIIEFTHSSILFVVQKERHFKLSKQRKHHFKVGKTRAERQWHHQRNLRFRSRHSRHKQSRARRNIQWIYHRHITKQYLRRSSSKPHGILAEFRRYDRGSEGSVGSRAQFYGQRRRGNLRGKNGKTFSEQ